MKKIISISILISLFCITNIQAQERQINKQGVAFVVGNFYTQINNDGTTFSFTLEYDGYLDFLSEGLASVEFYKKWGFVNKEGKTVIPLQYDGAGSFSENLASVKLNEKWGFIDKTGNIVIPYKYDDAGSFSDSLALVKSNGKWGLIDKIGNIVIPYKYDDTKFFSEDLALVKSNGKWGFINKKGNIVIQCKYDDAESFSEDLALVKSNGKWGFINKKGNIVIQCKYDNAKSFSEGLALVKLNGKWGFVNKTGKEIAPCKYDGIKPFSEGLAGIKLGGQLGFMDKTGKIVIPFFFNSTASMTDRTTFESAVKNGALTNKDNIFLSQWDYYLDPDNFNNFSGGIAIVGMDKRTVVIDKLGREIIQCEGCVILPFLEGTAVVLRNGSGGYVDLTGTWISSGTREEKLEFMRKRKKEGAYDSVLKQIAEAEEEFERRLQNEQDNEK